MDIKISVDYEKYSWKREYFPPEVIIKAISILFQKCGIKEGNFSVVLVNYDKMANTKDLLVEGGDEKTYLRYRLTNRRVLSVSVVMNNCNLSVFEFREALKSLSKKINEQAKETWERTGGIEDERRLALLDGQISRLELRKKLQEKRIQVAQAEIRKIEELVASKGKLVSDLKVTICSKTAQK